MNKFQIAASNYIDCGLNPLPLHAKKNPMLASGHDYLYAKHYDTDIFKRAESIGIACGEVSDNLFCIDFDQKQGNKVSEIFYLFTDSKIFKEVSERCAMYQTPSGGYHLIFKTTYPVPTRNLASFEDGSVMIEIRGQGAYIACEPSDGYKRLFDVSITDVERISNAQVNALLKLAVTFSQQTKTSLKPKSDRKKAESWDISKPDGKYNEECVDEVKELILKNGWQYVETRRDGIEYWTRPGKDPEDGHSATFGKFRHCFYVWTDGAQPLEQHATYNPFELYTIFEHAGDWRKAKDALADRFGMPRYKPITDDERSAVDFPIEVFPENMQRLILNYKQALNYNPDFIATSMMSAISMIVGNKIKLRVKSGWDAPLIFWFAIVGDRGTMKSHPLASALRPIKTIDQRSYNEWIHKLNEYTNVPEKDRKQEPRPEYRQIILQDSTLEALHRVHRHNPRGVGLYKDELVGFINDMNKYRGGSDEQFWLESFNNKSLVVNRATKDPMMIENCCINVIGTIQPDVLINIASKHTDNGLLDRFLYTKTETAIHVMSLDDVDQFLVDGYDDVIKQFDVIFEYYKETDTILLELTHEQLSIYKEYDQAIVDMQLGDEESPAMKSYLSKARTYFPRFVLMSVLLNAIESGSVEVSNDCIHNAWKITDYFNRSARDLFADSRTKTEIREIKGTMKGKTNVEKIKELDKMGLNRQQISSELGVSKQYIGKVLGKK